MEQNKVLVGVLLIAGIILLASGLPADFLANSPFPEDGAQDKVAPSTEESYREMDFQGESADLLNDVIEQKENSEVIASVHGEPIRAGEVKETLEALKEYDPEITPAKVTEKLIEQKLLLHEAQRVGITTETQEVEEVYQYYLSVNPEIPVQPESDLKKDIASQIMITKLLEEKLDTASLEVSDQEVDEYLENNAQAFEFFLEEEDQGLIDPIKEKIRSSMYKSKYQKAYDDYINGLKQEGAAVVY